MLFRKTPAFAGLAVRHGQLSLMKLKQIKKDIMIEGFASANVPSGSLSGSETLYLVIKELMEAVDAKNCHAALALPASHVINKSIRVASCLNDKERDAEIRANMNDYLPGTDGSLYFDFVPMEQHENDIELQLIAARSLYVETYLRAGDMAGLKIKIVDVDVYAIARAIYFILPQNKRAESCVILDIDFSSAQLILLKNGKIISIYPVSLEIEDLFFQQIKRGIQFFSTIEKNIKKIILTGDLSRLEQLKSVLEKILPISVSYLNYFKQVSANPDFNLKNDSKYLLAFGLALRGVYE
ncbi:MAG TPA: pilus assembly protein PilM [Gammaproteobacteria bacterium]|nr:pilus assembly protein PilM [Gammaproteobacteria bacterium]